MCFAPVILLCFCFLGLLLVFFAVDHALLFRILVFSSFFAFVFSSLLVFEFFLLSPFLILLTTFGLVEDSGLLIYGLTFASFSLDVSSF